MATEEEGTQNQGQQGQQGQGAPAGDGGEQQTFTAEEVKKLKEINQRLQGKVTEAEKKYDTFASMYRDIDPDEVKRLRQEKEDAERKIAENDPRKLEELFERKRQKEREEYEGKLTNFQKENEQFKRELKTLKVTDRVIGEIGKLFNDDALRFIKREVEEHCDLDDDGTILVKSDDGEVLYRGVRPMSVKEYGEYLITQFPSLAKSTATPGGKDAIPGQKVMHRGVKLPDTYEEFRQMGSPREIWDKLPGDKKVEFAQHMKVGGPR